MSLPSHSGLYRTSILLILHISYDKTFVHTSQKWTIVFQSFGSLQLPSSGNDDKELA